MAQNGAGFENCGAYRFVDLEVDELPTLRAALLEAASPGLRGTVLLSTEGINLRLSGPQEEVDAFIKALELLEPKFVGMDYRVSFGKEATLPRFLVKIKNELISMGFPAAKPGQSASPARSLPPLELKKWLDEKRDLVLLDTRNSYEVAVGAFRGAEHLELDTFRAFPERIKRTEALLLEATDGEKPVVMYCTGGIRCEKAAFAAVAAGFPEERLFQLQGGILKYFEDCGGAHYDQDCYVFDDRVAVSPQLTPANVVLCVGCRCPVRLEGERESVRCRECIAAGVARVVVRESRTQSRGTRKKRRVQTNLPEAERSGEIK